MVFARRSDAFQALKRYNNVQLDGKPMKIEIIGSNPEIPLSARVNIVGGTNRRRTVVMAYVYLLTPSFFGLIILLFHVYVCLNANSVLLYTRKFCIGIMLVLTKSRSMDVFVVVVVPDRI